VTSTGVRNASGHQGLDFIEMPRTEVVGVDSHIHGEGVRPPVADVRGNGRRGATIRDWNGSRRAGHSDRARSTGRGSKRSQIVEPGEFFFQLARLLVVISGHREDLLALNPSPGSSVVLIASRSGSCRQVLLRALNCGPYFAIEERPGPPSANPCRVSHKHGSPRPS
jgi:hypothetical protein